MIKLTEWEFKDEQYQTAKDKEKVLKNFVKCLEERSLESMTKIAYDHYHLHAGFIAHFNLHGFREEYSGSRFLTFLEYFAKPNWMFHRSDINCALMYYAKQYSPTIVQEFERKLHNKKIEQLKVLADSLGYKIVPKDATANEEATLLSVDETSGQLSLFGLAG